jgi:hypothetical protein
MTHRLLCAALSAIINAAFLAALAIGINGLLAGAARANTYHGDWVAATSPNQHGVVTAYTGSEKYRNSGLAVVYDPDTDCKPFLAVAVRLTSHAEDDVLDAGFGKVRVDENIPHALRAIVRMQRTQEGHMETHQLKLSAPVLRQLKDGHKVRVKLDERPADRFSLRGSRAAIQAAQGACERHRDMVDPDDTYFPGGAA